MIESEAKVQQPEKPLPTLEEFIKLFPEEENYVMKLINFLSEGESYEVGQIAKEYQSERFSEFLSVREVIEASKQGIIKCLYRGKVMDAVVIAEKFLANHQEVLLSQEIIVVAKWMLISFLELGDAIRVQQTIDYFLANHQDFLSDKKVLEAAQKGIIFNFRKGGQLTSSEIRTNKELIQKFFSDKPEEAVVSIKQALINCLLRGRVDNSVTIAKEFLADHQDVLASDEVVDAAKKRINNCMSEGWLHEAVIIAREFFANHHKILDKEMINVFERLSSRLLFHGSIEEAKEIKRETLANQSEKVDKVAKEKMIECLAEGRIEKAIKILNLFFANRPDILKHQNVLQAAKEIFFYCLALFLYDKCEQIRNKFLPDEPDLSFMDSINDISSADLREKAQAQMPSIYKNFYDKGDSVYKIWQEQFNNIPENNFLQSVEFANHDKKLLSQFDQLYSKIKKSTTRCGEMLFNITNIYMIEKDLQELLRKKLAELDVSNSKNFDSLSKIFRTLIFLDTIEKETRNYGHEQNEDSEKIKGIDFLDDIIKYATSIEELSLDLEQISLETLKDMLSLENLTKEKIDSLWKEWGDLNPLFIYVGKMKGAGYNETLKLVGEMVSKMDPPNYEGWKTWRYKKENKIVENQIGFLNDEQREIWKADYAVELGELEIAITPTDKPEIIFAEIKKTIESKHIADSKLNKTEDQFIQNYLKDLFDKNDGNFEKISSEAPKKIEELKKDAEEINKYNRLFQEKIKDISNLEKIIERLKIHRQKIEEQNPIPKELRKDKEFVEYLRSNNFSKVSSIQEIQNLLGRISNQELEDKIESLLKKKTKIEDEKQNFFKSFNLKDFEKELLQKYNLDLNLPESESREKIEKIKSKDIKIESEFVNRIILENKIQNEELDDFLIRFSTVIDALTKFLRLSSLTPQQLAMDRFNLDKKRTDENIISKTLEKLKGYFRGNQALLGNLKNIEVALERKAETGKKRLAMIFNDNPQIGINIGKYPIGCGSCQNYEGDTRYNHCLAGYMADAKTKFMLVIDIEKLPKIYQESIDEKGIDETIKEIPARDILTAMLGREIVKLGKDNDNNPYIFLEPTYSVTNKGDQSENKVFNLFTEILVVEPMKVKMARGGGKTKINFGKTRNPNGEYEDSGAGRMPTGDFSLSAHEVTKQSLVTKEEQELAERIRSSRR